MRAFTIVLSSSFLAAAAACSHPHPAPMISSGPVPPPAPAAAPVDLELDGAPWSIAVAGGTVSSPDEYRRKVDGPGYSVEVSAWPNSDAFVQTLAEHLEGYKEKGQFDVIHQVDGGRGAFEAVLHINGTYDGTVLVASDGSDGGMCTFTLPDTSDWHAALAACESLRPATSDGADGNDGYDGDGDPCGGDPCGGYDDNDGGYDDPCGDPCGD